MTTTTCLKTTTPDGLIAYHKDNEALKNLLDRLNAGRQPQNQTKYEYIELTHEQMVKFGIISGKEAKETQSAILAEKDAQIEALKKQLEEKLEEKQPEANAANEPQEEEKEEITQQKPKQTKEAKNGKG